MASHLRRVGAGMRAAASLLRGPQGVKQGVRARHADVFCRREVSVSTCWVREGLAARVWAYDGGSYGC